MRNAARQCCGILLVFYLGNFKAQSEVGIASIGTMGAMGTVPKVEKR